LETTRRASSNAFQGMMIVSGNLAPNEEIVEPGPELQRMVQENIDSYLVAHPAPATDKPAEMPVAQPAPAAAATPDANTLPTTELTAPVLAPTP
jgi:hypothetical protein